MNQLIDKNFDLEQGILRCWNVCDDIDDMIEVIKKNYTSQEDIIQLLNGFRAVYHMRFERVFGVYEDVCRGLHELRKERDALDLELRTTRFDVAQADVAKKPQSKKGKSKKAKAVDQ